MSSGPLIEGFLILIKFELLTTKFHFDLLEKIKIDWGYCMKNLCVILFSLLTTFAAQADTKFRLIEFQQNEYWLHSGSFAGGPPVVVSNGLYAQKLDHFSAPDARTFSQRYFYSSTVAKGKAAPVLIYICGEGQCSAGALYGPIAQHARLVGAHLFALEHRYYGKTQPFQDLSTENLKYLSTEQALEDIVQFKRAMQTKMGLTGPWVSVGGSYAGNLSAYLRALYPQDFIGALASSAPVLPDANFSEYDRHVARMAGRTCASVANKVIAGVENEIVSDEGFLAAKERFSAQTLSRRDDFLYLLSDIASAAIQYGMRDDFCAALEAKGEAGYVEMKARVDKLFGDFADYSAEAAENIDVLKHSGGLGMRQWFYQSCTEYGYWQNADPSESMRSKQINANYHDELCHRLFGMAKIGSVNNILKKFYEPLLNPINVSRILYTNGVVDPWSNLSITTENGNHVNPNTEALVIPGASHCSDLGLGGTAEVMAAKSHFQSVLSNWLKP